MVLELFGKPALFTDDLIGIGTVSLCFTHIYFYLCYTIFKNSANLSIPIPPQLSICLSLPDLFKLF
jgi:phage-related holin